jgi:hypothetical protein
LVSSFSYLPYAALLAAKLTPRLRALPRKAILSRSIIEDGRRRRRVNQEEIQQEFASAGWELDDGFYKHLIIGYTDSLSILAYRPAWETEEDPEFQLCDHENGLAYWVREIPSPQRAAQLLTEYGEPLNE